MWPPQVISVDARALWGGGGVDSTGISGQLNICTAMRLTFLAVGLAIFALGGCEVPQGAVSPISQRAARAPAPALIETARFDAALASAEPDTRRLATDRDALAARAAALQARAAGLVAPVMPSDERARLEAGVASPPVIADPGPAEATEPAPDGAAAPAPGGTAAPAPGGTQ
jgi:hypothetical protein